VFVTFILTCRCFHYGVPRGYSNSVRRDSPRPLTGLPVRQQYFFDLGTQNGELRLTSSCRSVLFEGRGLDRK